MKGIFSGSETDEKFILLIIFNFVNLIFVSLWSYYRCFHVLRLTPKAI